MTIGVIVCAYNEACLLAGCLHSLRAQTRTPDDILVINNASVDGTAAVARGVPGGRVVDEPVKGLVVARETARRHARTDILAYVDADCRAPISWLERVESRFQRGADPLSRASRARTRRQLPVFSLVAPCRPGAAPGIYASNH